MATKKRSEDFDKEIDRSIERPSAFERLMTALVHPIPVNMRMYLNNFRKHPTPLKNEDLWESDREAIRHATAASTAASRWRDKEILTPTTGWQSLAAALREPPAPGVIGYGDYGDVDRTLVENVPNIIFKSLTSPAYRMETTLGMANFREDPSGQIKVDDAYDFNSPRASTNLMKKHPYGILGAIASSYQNNGPLGVGNAIGNIMRSEGEGTPFTLTIPPKKEK